MGAVSELPREPLELTRAVGRDSAEERDARKQRADERRVRGRQQRSDSIPVAAHRHRDGCNQHQHVPNAFMQGDVGVAGQKPQLSP